jgi:prepilin-type N-terminal cleavage/methylation domain-containing protein/prepilin-type processing-associated H-X9-DG protein
MVCGTNTRPTRRAYMSNRRRAFTLIELLVVVSIIALLVSILMPSLGKAREQARRVVCVTNCKTMGLAANLYADQSNEYVLPVLSGWLTSKGDAANNNKLWFQNKLFVKLVEFQGAKNSEAENKPNAGTYILTLPDDFKCPSDRRTVGNGILYIASDNQILGVSYSYNLMSLLVPGKGYNYYHYHGVGKRSVVRHPSQKMLTMDGLDYCVYETCADYTVYWDLWGEKTMSDYHAWNAPSYRHGEGANLAFFDGHAAYMRKEDVYRKGANAIEEQKLNAPLWLTTGKWYADATPNWGVDAP